MPLVLVARAVLFCVILQRLQQRVAFVPRDTLDVGRAIEVEVQRRVGSAQPDQLGALCRVEELVPRRACR